jgi:hypothetical protein
MVFTTPKFAPVTPSCYSLFMKLSDRWRPALLLSISACLSLQAQTNLFVMPRIFPRHAQLAQTFRVQLRRGDYAAMEQTCREGLDLLPDDPTWRYNLACTLARQSRQQEALAELGKAVDLGFRDVQTITADSDLATLRRLSRFSRILDRARDLQNEPVAGRPRLAPILVENQALVTPSNTTWNLDIGQFQTFFTFPPGRSPATNERVRLPGPAGDAIRAWQADGTAAGHAGDLYDNRDESHSLLRLDLFPGMRPIVYADEARQANVHSGLSLFTFMGTPVLGNASTALVNGPFWRSLARQAYCDGRSSLFLSLQYLRNQHYVFPQHRDYRADVEGDTFPAATPYLTIAPGSSFTDQPLLEAFAATLAAFRPEVKAALVKNGMLIPTLQMLLRASQKEVARREDYLTRKAHPPVFDGARLDLLRMVTLAHDMTTNALPPLAILRTIEEKRALPGRDFFDPAGGEALFDSPAAIARIARGMAYTRRIVVDGRASRNPMPSHLKAHWVLLQGQPDKVRIHPRIGDPLVAEIEVDYPGGSFPIATNNPMRTSRVEVALIVDNGTHFSPPAYVTFYFLNNEIRKYAQDGRILIVDYRGAAGRYTDPMLSLPKRWMDLYLYDTRNRLTGWTRVRGGESESFTLDGARVLTRDANGRALTARVVAYLRREGRDDAGHVTLELVQTDTDRVRRYRYASDDDTLGEPQDEIRQPAPRTEP